VTSTAAANAEAERAWLDIRANQPRRKEARDALAAMSAGAATQNQAAQGTGEADLPSVAARRAVFARMAAGGSAPRAQRDDLDVISRGIVARVRADLARKEAEAAAALRSPSGKLRTRERLVLPGESESAALERAETDDRDLADALEPSLEDLARASVLLVPIPTDPGIPDVPVELDDAAARAEQANASLPVAAAGEAGDEEDEDDDEPYQPLRRPSAAAVVAPGPPTTLATASAEIPQPAASRRKGATLPAPIVVGPVGPDRRRQRARRTRQSRRPEPSAAAAPAVPPGAMLQSLPIVWMQKPMAPPPMQPLDAMSMAPSSNMVRTCS
jgi:hypothetical protein